MSQSVLIRRDLARADPVACRPNLAASLNILALRLLDMGQSHPAWQAIEESVAIRQDLAAQAPAKFSDGLNNALDTRMQVLGQMRKNYP